MNGAYRPCVPSHDAPYACAQGQRSPSRALALAHGRRQIANDDARPCAWELRDGAWRALSPSRIRVPVRFHVPGRNRIEGGACPCLCVPFLSRARVPSRARPRPRGQNQIEYHEPRAPSPSPQGGDASPPRDDGARGLCRSAELRPRHEQREQTK